MILLLVVAQSLAAVVAYSRLLRWRRRSPPIAPDRGAAAAGAVSIIVPTLNEGRRIQPLLDGLVRQSNVVRETIVVDSHSADDTKAVVRRAAARDPRIRFTLDEPLPGGWIGKAWALECARRDATGDWLLFLDADVDPHPSLADAVVTAATERGLAAASFSPRFAGQTAAERWIQPSLLVSLIYRTEPGGSPRASRVAANGQCFLVRRDALERCGGFASVRASFAEDVSLARHLSQAGERVGFLDGRMLYDVRSYESASQMWREWGRSIDLKDSTSAVQQAIDVALIALVQGASLPMLIGAALGVVAPVLAIPSIAFMITRLMLGIAIRHHYAERGASYWLSPLTDPLAALRVFVSSLRRPRAWRGRVYP